MLAVFSIANSVLAKSVSDITYPVGELGNCESREACKTYCDDPANVNACISFGKQQNLISSVNPRANLAAVGENGETGPGGCENREACHTYCDESANAEECFTFGKEHGLITAEQEKKFEQKKKIDEVLKSGGGPGGCTSPEACKTYCSDSANLKECVTFGKANGLLSPDEASRMEKQGFKAVVHDDEERGPRPGKLDDNFEGPGNCKGPDECRKYCDDPVNQETCISYGVEHGFMSKEEGERARKMVNQTGPGGCRGQECKAYCDDPAHREECITHAEENGFMTKEKAMHAREMRKIEEQGGPGGCKGPDECRAYCEDQEAHGEECFQFGKEHNLINPDQQQRFEEGKMLRAKIQENGGPGGCTSPEGCKDFCSDPNNIEECNDFSVKQGAISPEQAQMRLEKFSRQAPGFDEQGRPVEGGPFDPRMRRPEGDGFMPPRGGQGEDGQPFARPDGCTTKEECEDVCKVNPEKCMGSGERPRMPIGEGRPPMVDENGKPIERFDMRNGMRPEDGEFREDGRQPFPPDGQWPDDRMPVDGKMFPPNPNVRDDQARKMNPEMMKDGRSPQPGSEPRPFNDQNRDMKPGDSPMQRPPATAPYRSPDGVFGDRQIPPRPANGEFQKDQMSGDMLPQPTMPGGTFQPRTDGFVPPPPPTGINQTPPPPTGGTAPAEGTSFSPPPPPPSDENKVF